MSKPAHHIFVCGSYRPTGAAGVCHKKESPSILQHLTMEAEDRGLADVMISSTGCMNRCEKGPLMVVYPAGSWYGEVDEEKIDTILDALSEGREATKLLLA